VNLLESTYALVDQTSLSQREIASGSGVGLEWFRKFMRRRIPSPGVTKVQAVHDFLSRQPARRDHAAWFLRDSWHDHQCLRPATTRKQFLHLGFSPTRKRQKSRFGIVL